MLSLVTKSDGLYLSRQGGIRRIVSTDSLKFIDNLEIASVLSFINKKDFTDTAEIQSIVFIDWPII